MRIEIENASVDFHHPPLRALEDVTLTIREGERVALLGPSGSGKSTLLRLILGGVRLSSGRARVDGHNPFGTKQDVAHIRRHTGTVRQRDDLVIGLTGRTNALMGTSPRWNLFDWLALVRGHTPRRYVDQLSRLALHFGIEPCLASRVENLSGGQRQRVAMVRALLGCPRLLLADEPTSGLDPLNTEVMVETMLNAEAPTLVLATHDLAIAKKLERVVALRHGRVSYDGPPPSDEAFAALYGSSEEAACV